MDDVDDAASMDSTNGIETVLQEDVAGGIIRRLTVADSVDGTESADTVCSEASVDSADLTDSGSMEIDDRVDQSAKDQSTSGESDGDSTNEGSCLEAMTPSGKDHYLRLGGTPRRRSALRLSRIIARQQLLRRLAQGRNRQLWASGHVWWDSYKKRGEDYVKYNPIL